MNRPMLAALLAGAIGEAGADTQGHPPPVTDRYCQAYPLPGVVVNGPAPIFTSVEEAALCADALWVDANGRPEKPKDQARYEAAREACDKARESLKPGVRVIVEGSSTGSDLLHGSSAYRVQGLVVRFRDWPSRYEGVVDFWVPGNRIRLLSVKATAEKEQKALWQSLVDTR